MDPGEALVGPAPCGRRPASAAAGPLLYRRPLPPIRLGREGRWGLRPVDGERGLPGAGPREACGADPGLRGLAGRSAEDPEGSDRPPGGQRTAPGGGGALAGRSRRRTETLREESSARAERDRRGLRRLARSQRVPGLGAVLRDRAAPLAALPGGALRPPGAAVGVGRGREVPGVPPGPAGAA